MKKNITAFAFIAVSATIVYFSNDFQFIKSFLRLSPLFVGIFAALTFAACLRFNKSNISFMLALLLIWFFKDKIPLVAVIPKNEFILFISVNLLYLVLSAERGVFSVYGLQKAGLIILQLGLFYYFTALSDSLYYRPGIPVIQTVHDLMNLPYAPVPFLLIVIAAAGCIIRGSSHDISFAGGAIIGFFALFLQGGDITALNMLAALSLMFIGTLASIYTISYIDELTGLPGRRAYNEFTATLGSTYTIAMADIDHFKKFNDTHGHDTGDEVLKLVAKILATIGGGGKPFRFGGEEFVIVFNGKFKEKTAGHLESIRKKIEQTPFTVRNRTSRKQFNKTGEKKKPVQVKNIKITMSFGAGDSRDENNPVKVMKAADEALYTSKKQGRNRVTV